MMLTDRRQTILRALIEEYVSRAIPISSRSIVDSYHLQVSPATVRNDLSFLEEAGYIVQPHTSAGRIPTEAGYREFVDELIDMHELHVSDDVVSDIQRCADEIDELLKEVSCKLSNLTNCLSVVAKNESDYKVEKHGITSIMKQPEFQKSTSLLPIMEILEDDNVLLDALDISNNNEKVNVCIGSENKIEKLSGVSVVAGSFGEGASRGVVAVIGPTRMNYSEVIGAVMSALNVLDDE